MSQFILIFVYFGTFYSCGIVYVVVDCFQLWCGPLRQRYTLPRLWGTTSLKRKCWGYCWYYNANKFISLQHRFTTQVEVEQTIVLVCLLPGTFNAIACHVFTELICAGSPTSRKKYPVVKLVYRLWRGVKDGQTFAFVILVSIIHVIRAMTTTRIRYFVFLL